MRDREPQHAAELAPIAPLTLVREMVGTDRYGGLLLSLLGSLVLFGVVREIRFGGVLRGIVLALALVLAVRAAGVPWRRAGLWFGAGAAAMFAPLVADAVVVSHTLPVVADTTTLILSLLMGTLVARRLVQHSRVAIGTILGALCVYLILGMLFSSAFAILTKLQPGFFATENVRAADYLYFSFGQLTTVGSPPLRPGTDLARMLAVLEALVGQIYLVTVVALLVSNLGRARSRR